MERITRAELPDYALEIDRKNESNFGPCSCCGEMTSRVWGYAYRAGVALAAYYVEWTPGHKIREATFDLIIGDWGEQAGGADRKAVSVSFRHLETGPGFMIQNSSTRPFASSRLVTEALDRDDVLGTALAADVFAVCDLAYFGDPRLSALRADQT